MIDVLHSWVHGIETNDSSKVVKLYHENAILLGTFSDIERQGLVLIQEYFEGLFSSKIGVEIVTRNDFKTRILTTCSGLYNFKVNGEITEARYTFVFIKVEDSWKILTHHSSVLPK